MSKPVGGAGALFPKVNVLILNRGELSVWIASSGLGLIVHDGVEVSEGPVMGVCPRWQRWSGEFGGGWEGGVSGAFFE